MTVLTSSLISHKLAQQPYQEERFRALDRNLARKYVMLLLRQARMAEARRLKQEDILYRPRYVCYFTVTRPAHLCSGWRFVMTHPVLA